MNSEIQEKFGEGANSLFSQLIMMLATSTMQQLGLMAEPGQEGAPANLEGAQITIDLLEMLGLKTLGNLDTEEEKMLGETLSSLQMLYVKTVQGTPAADAPPADPEPALDEEPEPIITSPLTSSQDKGEGEGGEDEKKPKFQKKYD